MPGIVLNSEKVVLSQGFISDSFEEYENEDSWAP